MEKNTQKRQVAYKTSVQMINDAKFVKDEGWNPNYLLIEGKKVSRVNILGTVIEKRLNEQNQLVKIDDGSGLINAISFEGIVGFDELQVGDVVLIIGKPRLYGEEKYVMPEIIKKTDKEWLKVRKVEISGYVSKPESENVVLDDESDPIDVIKALDKGEGVSGEELNIKIGEKTLNLLLEKGEIFEIKPGKFKLLE